MTANDERISKDLARSDRRQIPVNLIYPANYPEEPAILLEGLFFAKDALKALDRAAELSASRPDITTETSVAIAK